MLHDFDALESDFNQLYKRVINDSNKNNIN